jgi:hypothetical protein
VDTTEQGLALARGVRTAHNSDQSAHLVLVRERGTLLVRMVRRHEHAIFESRTTYRPGWGGYIIHDHQLRQWEPDDEAPRIVQEEYYFRDADGFRTEAPGFFPFVSRGEGPHWREITEEVSAPLVTRRGRER